MKTDHSKNDRQVVPKATCTTDRENATLKPPVAWEDSESGFQLGSPFEICGVFMLSTSDVDFSSRRSPTII
jgi:hypothetical protein